MLIPNQINKSLKGSMFSTIQANTQFTLASLPNPEL
jgi:hypothetical protein